jgi:hypothetical protein
MDDCPFRLAIASTISAGAGPFPDMAWRAQRRRAASGASAERRGWSLITSDLAGKTGAVSVG